MTKMTHIQDPKRSLKWKWPWLVWLSLLERHLVRQKVLGSIPGEGHTGSNWSMFLPPPHSLKKYTQKQKSELPDTQPKASPQNVNTNFINLIFLYLTHLSNIHLSPTPLCACYPIFSAPESFAIQCISPPLWTSTVLWECFPLYHSLYYLYE